MAENPFEVEVLQPEKKKGGWFPWVLALIGFGTAAGIFLGLYQPVAKRDRAAATDAQEQKKQLAAAKEEADKMRAEMGGLREDLAKSTAQKAQDDKLLEQLKKEMGAGGAEVTGEGQRITVTMVDKILFKSASADLTPKGEEELRKLGGVLKGVEDKLIEVCGHADNLPVESAIKELYPTNWELSTARATNVVRFLQDEAGVKPRRLKAAGYGSTRPVASNKKEAGRAKNRRIEILLLPEKMKVVKGDFSDEVAAAPPPGKTSGKDSRPTDQDRLKALQASKAKEAAATKAPAGKATAKKSKRH